MEIVLSVGEGTCSQRIPWVHTPWVNILEESTKFCSNFLERIFPKLRKEWKTILHSVNIYLFTESFEHIALKTLNNWKRIFKNSIG